MLELTTINTTGLVNKKLGTQLNNIKKAVETGYGIVSNSKRGYCIFFG